MPETPASPYIVSGLMVGCEWKQGNWRNIHELDLVVQAVKDLSGIFGPGNIGQQVFKNIYNPVLISRWKTDPIANINKKITKKDIIRSFAPPGDLAHTLGDVVLPDYTFDQVDSYVKFQVVHELSHVWDYRTVNQLSLGIMMAVNSWVCDTDPARNYCYWDPSESIEPAPDAVRNCDPKQPGPGCPGGDAPYSQTYGGAGPLEWPGWEDWAQSLAYYVYESYDPDTYGLGQRRRNYVQEQIRDAKLP